MRRRKGWDYCQSLHIRQVLLSPLATVVLPNLLLGGEKPHDSESTWYQLSSSVCINRRHGAGHSKSGSLWRLFIRRRKLSWLEHVGRRQCQQVVRNSCRLQRSLRQRAGWAVAHQQERALISFRTSLYSSWTKA